MKVWKGILVFIVGFGVFVLYAFRPWGQEKEGWTLITGILALILMIGGMLSSYLEEKKEEKKNKKWG